MGSLYDIGNMRYKHFTFYSRGEASDYTPLDAEFPGVTQFPEGVVTDAEKAAYITQQEGLHQTAYDKLIDELTNFLESVWPLDAIFGYNAEDDTAYVTYIKQSSGGDIEIENIYTFRRSTPKFGGNAKWMLALAPIKSVNPEDYISTNTNTEGDS